MSQSAIDPVQLCAIVSQSAIDPVQLWAILLCVFDFFWGEGVCCQSLL